MGFFVQILVGASLVFIVTIYAVWLVRYIRLPVHLRWELYPVPHEEGWKYGGSYFEQYEWWAKLRKKNRLRDIWYHIKDYTLFHQYFTRNRGLWYFLYPYHIGFYAIVGSHALYAYGAILIISGTPVSPESVSTWGQIIYWLSLLVGVGFFIFGALGCIGIFIRRLVKEDLRRYATPLNHFSPLFYLSVFVSGLYCWYFTDPDLSKMREFMLNLITFTPQFQIDTSLAIHMILFSGILIYMPLFTPTFHYVTKFLTYFAVRWNDELNLRGSEREKKIQKLLDQKVTWSAPHIQLGKKWGEIATEVKFPDKTEAK